MKKIMFNDALGLTQAVLEGRKTQTRREIPELKDIDSERIRSVKVENVEDDGSSIFAVYLPNGERRLVAPKFKVGEVVAIAQRYEDIFMTVPNECRKNHLGWRNKMFVKANFMPHHIMVKEIRAERLQDISDEDCVKEGVMVNKFMNTWDKFYFEVGKMYHAITAPTEKEAYQMLITRTCGYKIWKRNPFVWVIDFELVD